MKMKKKLLLLAAAALACVPVWASAAILVNGAERTPDSDGKISITSNATVSGSGENVYLEVDAGVTELTLENLSITAPTNVLGKSALLALKSDENTLTLTIKGNNTLTGSGGTHSSGCGILAKCDLIIKGQANSRLTATDGEGVENRGIHTNSGVLKVKGNSCVTAQGSDYTALKDGPAPISVEADGLMIYADGDEASAVVVPDYTQLTKYLRIEGLPAQADSAAASGSADLPQTGDASRMGLWLMLACASMLGMAAVRAKREA